MQHTFKVGQKFKIPRRYKLGDIVVITRISDDIIDYKWVESFSNTRSIASFYELVSDMEPVLNFTDYAKKVS